MGACFYFAVFCLLDLINANYNNSRLKFLSATHANIECQHNKAKHLANNLIVNDSPQSIHEFYICGWDNNSMLLPKNNYNITYTLSSLNYATFQHFTQINNSTNVLSLKINSFPSKSEGLITLYSPSTLSNNITIRINLTNCHDGYYQNGNNVSFNCTLCENNTYSMHTNKCKQCNHAMTCLDGNNVSIKKHYYGININGTIQTAYCLSNYCCNNDEGCSISNNMCIKHRNSSTLLCTSCDNGYCETINSMNGICVTCDDQHTAAGIELFLFFACYLVICVVLVWIVYNISYYLETQDPDSSTNANEFVICIWFNLLTFYQTMLYLHSYGLELQSKQLLSYIANLNLFLFNISLGSNITSRGKLIVLLCPVFMFIVIICTLYFVLNIKYKNKINEYENAKNALKCTIWHVLTLTYLHTFSIFMKLSHCVNINPFGMKIMGWNGNVKCYDVQQILSMIIAIFGLIVFPCYLCFYFQKKKERNLSFILYGYRQSIWPQYEIISFIRKGIPLIIIFWINNAIYIGYFQLILLLIHVGIMPFKNRLNNEIEMFLLIISFIISVFGYTSPIFDNQNIIEYIIIILSFSPLLIIPYTLYLYTKSSQRIGMNNVFNCNQCKNDNNPVYMQSITQNIELQ